MTSPQQNDFYEAIHFADYVIKMALVELSELDQQSLKTIQSIPEYHKDTTQLLEAVQSAKALLNQSGKIATCLIKVNSEVSR